MIVVGTNIIGYLFLTSSKSLLCEQAFRKDPIWAAPLLWRSELRTVLAKYLRGGYLNLDDARQIMSAASVLMQSQEYEVTSEHVLDLVNTSACSAYDCEFVALAQDLGRPLVTADQQILRDFPEIAVSLEAFIGNG
jgi:predicted nucleic acid-binding protein